MRYVKKIRNKLNNNLALKPIEYNLKSNDIIKNIIHQLKLDKKKERYKINFHPQYKKH